MALTQKDIKGYGIFGAVAALAVPLLLKTLNALLSAFSPTVSINLQSIAIETQGLGAVVNTGLSSFATKIFGLIPLPIQPSEWLMIAIGGALFTILGAWLADQLNLLNGSTQKKVSTVFVIAGIVSGWLLSMSIKIPTLPAILEMVINAFILSWVMVKLDKSLKTNLVPN